MAGADAVANNLRGDVPAKLGLTYSALKEHNPAIVCAHCSAYGRMGPRQDWPGYDFLMEAEAGYFHMSGEPETPPTRMGLSVVDFMAGTYMALGLVSGVLGARSTGIGRDIDVNLYDTALFNLSYLSAWALNSEYAPSRVSRSAHASLVPCQLYRTADGWIYIMCNKEKFWTSLCSMIERPDLTEDPRFSSFAQRLQNRDTLTEILDTGLSANKTEHWLQLLQGHVPLAPIRTPREALNDPELRADGRISQTQLRDGTKFDLLTSPIVSGNSKANCGCSPMGHDTETILSDAGYTASEIQKFRDQDLI